MYVKLLKFVREDLSYESKRAIVVAIVVLFGMIVALFIEGSRPQEQCAFEDNTAYPLLYLNSPAKLESLNDKVVWRTNACGSNIKNMYSVTMVPDSYGKCTVTQIQVTQEVDGEIQNEPWYVLTLPDHYTMFCPAKPIDVTPVADS